MNLNLDIAKTMHINEEFKVHKKLIKYEQVLFYNNTRREKEIVIIQS